MNEDKYREILMTVMSFIRDVRAVSEFVDGMFAPLKDQVGLLKRHTVPMDRDFLTDIESAKTF